MDPKVVAQDQPVANAVTVSEVDESTPSDPMASDLILDQLVENISSNLQLEDATGLTSPTGSGPVKLVEKKRNASTTDFASTRFILKTKKTTRYVYMKEGLM